MSPLKDTHPWTLQLPHPMGAVIKSWQDLKRRGAGKAAPLENSGSHSTRCPHPSWLQTPLGSLERWQGCKEEVQNQGAFHHPFSTQGLRQEAIAFRDVGNSFHVRYKKKKPATLLSVLSLKPFPAEQHPWQLALRAQEGNALVGCRQAGGPAVPSQMDGGLTAELGRCEGFGRGCKYCT